MKSFLKESIGKAFYEHKVEHLLCFALQDQDVLTVIHGKWEEWYKHAPDQTAIFNSDITGKHITAWLGHDQGSFCLEPISPVSMYTFTTCVNDFAQTLPCPLSTKSLIFLEEQGWRSGWAFASHQCGPGSIPGLGVKCGLSLLLVLVLALRDFSPGTPVFPSPQTPTFPNSNSIWNLRATGLSVVPLSVTLVNLAMTK